MGTVMGIFMLEKLWSWVNDYVPIEEMATAVAGKIYEEAGVPIAYLKPRQVFRNKLKRTS